MVLVAPQSTRAAHKAGGGGGGDSPPNFGKSFGFLQQNSAKIFAFCRFFDSLPYSIPKSFGASRRSCTNVKKLLLRGNFFKIFGKKLSFVKICGKKSIFFQNFQEKMKFCQNLPKKVEFFPKISEKN